MFCIGVVGTRDITDYGEEATRKFCFELARNGFTVVSGLAMGVDAVAASSAIMAGGNTIAVLGCGIDTDYPKPNGEIRKSIEKYGAVVTEYPVGTQPLGSNFPQRNRIIAGLSECVLVTQAPKRSGALITASYAVDMGKEVFCIPASIFDSYSIGNNNLIKEGAIPVTSPQDITEIYKHQLTDFIPKETRANIEVSKPKSKATFKEVVEKIKEKVIKPSINDERYKNLDETQKTIMELIIEYEKLSVDEIIRKTNIPPAKIGATLSLMEMTGAIKKLPGNFYVIS
jgi:DNA processing protein